MKRLFFALLCLTALNFRAAVAAEMPSEGGIPPVAEVPSLSAASSSFSALPSDRSAVRDSVVACAGRTQTMECRFVQTRHLDMLDEDIVSKGTMAFCQPDKLRWEYTEPYVYRFVLNGGRILLQSEERSDVVDVNASDMFQAIADIILNSMTGNILLDTKNFAQEFRASGREYTAVLQPVSGQLKDFFQQIDIVFDAGSYQVIRVVLSEESGDTTTVVLSRESTGRALDAALFAIPSK